jgi:putative membrane protein
MSDLQPGVQASRFTVKPTADSHFAWLRTHMALENTMLAWVRTAVSMIGFGFAIVQFLDNLHKLPDTSGVIFVNAPWLMGLALIFCGVLVLVVALWEYRWLRRYLNGGDFTPVAGLTEKGMHLPVYTAAIVLMVIGIFAFFAVLLHLV